MKLKFKYFVLIFLGSLFATPVLAASPTRIGSTATGNFSPATQNTVAYTVPSGINTALVVQVSTGGNNSDPTSVLWGGCSGTSLTKLASANVGWGVSSWLLVSPTAQTSTVCVNLGSSIRHNVVVMTYENVQQTSTLDISGTNAPGSATSNSKSVVTTVNNDICIVQLGVDFGVSSVTDNSGQTRIESIVDTNSTLNTYVSEKEATTAGSVSLGYTWTTSKISDLVVTCLKYEAPSVASEEESLIILFE